MCKVLDICVQSTPPTSGLMCWVVKCLELRLTIDWLGGRVSRLYCDSRSQVKMGLVDSELVNICVSQIDCYAVVKVSENKILITLEAIG